MNAISEKILNAVKAIEGAENVELSEGGVFDEVMANIDGEDIFLIIERD